MVETTNYANTSGGVTTNNEEVKTFKNKTKLSLYFAKNFFDWTLKGGLIEDTGGIGVDYHMLDDRLTAGVEAYDFQKLQLRANLSYKVFYGIYLSGGYSDILNKRDANSAYLGAGLFLTNDDIKLLLAKSPF